MNIESGSVTFANARNVVSRIASDNLDIIATVGVGAIASIAVVGLIAAGPIGWGILAGAALIGALAVGYVAHKHFSSSDSVIPAEAHEGQIKDIKDIDPGVFQKKDSKPTEKNNVIMMCKYDDQHNMLRDEKGEVILVPCKFVDGERIEMPSNNNAPVVGQEQKTDNKKADDKRKIEVQPEKVNSKSDVATTSIIDDRPKTDWDGWLSLLEPVTPKERNCSLVEEDSLLPTKKQTNEMFASISQYE